MQQQKESGKGMSKANSRQRRTHVQKRKRYRAKMFSLFIRKGVNAEGLGRKLRKLAKVAGGLNP